PYIWCAHIKACFNRLMFHFWPQWFGVYVDDNIGGGRTYEEANRRLPESLLPRSGVGLRIFKLACEVLDKKLSPKVDSSVRESVTTCGITFLPQGKWRLSDHNIQKLRNILTIEPTTREWMRKLIGTLSYCRSLFDFGVDNCAGFGEEMAKLTTCFKSKPYRLTDAARSAIEALRRHLAISPRVAFGVQELLFEEPDDSRLLAVTFDGSDTAVGGALFLVRGKTAATLSIQDLQDPVSCSMIDAFSLVLNSSQQRWFTFEIESYGLFICLTRWRRLFVAVCRDIPDPSLPARIVIFSDSTTALKHWDTATVPTECRIGSIKARRFAGWQSEVAEYRYLPILLKFASGTTNVVADVFSRYENILRTSSTRPRPRFLLPSTSEATTFPGDRPSEPDFNDEDYLDPAFITADQGVMPIPSLGPIAEGDDTVGELHHEDGGVYFDLNLNDEEIQALAEAYHRDYSTEYHGIPLAYIYRFLVDDLPTDPKVPTIAMTRLRAWRDTRFTVRQPPHQDSNGGPTARILYTPSPNRRSNPERVVWVAVIPTGVEWPVDKPDRLVLVNTFHLNTTTIDARQLLLAWSHDCQGHCGGGESAHQLWFVAWWPSSLNDHMDFRSTCPSCSRRLMVSGVNKSAALGQGETERRRFTTLQIDHKDVPQRLVPFTKYKAILSLTDVGTGVTQFHPVESKDSTTTVRMIYCHWVTVYGRPLHLHADGGFSSQCFRDFASVMGCRVKISASRNPTGNSRVERRNNYLSEALASEPITDDASLELAVATACIKANQISRPDGEFTAFEACFGAPPNRLVEAIGDYHREDGQATLEEEPIDDDFINKIRYNIRESLGSIHAHADARAHYSLTGRVADQQRSRGLSHNFTAGQQVLVKGRDLEVPLSIIKIYSDDNGDSRVLVLEDGSRVPAKDCFHPPVKRHYFCRAGGLTH
ncbi:hypothetical protein FOZ62_030763, partial [Perkinsus olseni]